MQQPLEHRAYLLHMSHYDGRGPVVEDGAPFSLDTARRMVDDIAELGFNLLMIGVSDGIVYASHPEFARPYSQPREQLRTLAEHARERGLDVVPKLNFSQSEINLHNQWMRAPDEEWHTHFDDEYYWKTAFECIDEVIELCAPEGFFHVGMDEDHNRSYTQFVDATRRLDAGIRERGLSTITWSDSGLDYPSGHIYVEKSMRVEQELEPPLVRLLWNYWAVPEAAIRSIVERGHRLWCAPGSSSFRHDRSLSECAAQITAFRDATKRFGGEGIVMTNWEIASAVKETALREYIRELGPLFSE